MGLGVCSNLEVAVCARGQQHLHDVCVAAECSVDERCVAGMRLCVHARTVIEQDLHNSPVALDGGVMQWRVLLGSEKLCVNVRALVKEKLDDFEVPSAAGAIERSPAILGRHVAVCARVQQQSDNASMPFH